MKVHLGRRLGWPLALVLALVAPLFVAAVAAAQVVIPPIAPPKPAAPRVANATSIGIGDLSEGVNFAVQGNFDAARTSFNLFKDDWTAVREEVVRQSSDIADMVDDAIAEVQALVDETPAPAQSRYLPVYRKLSDVVEEANQQLALIAPTTGALRIPTPDLGQSVSWASQGNLAKAHDEFEQFQDDWSLIRDTVGQSLPTGAAAIDAATLRVQNLIANPANPNPAQADYFGALQALQQAVVAANAQLATMAPSAGGAPQGALNIRVRDLAEAVESAGADDLARARSEFGQFAEGWATLAGPVRTQRPDLADLVDAAVVQVRLIFGASNPAKTEYLPALQLLQEVVEAANGELAAAPPAPAAAPVAAGAAVTIRVRDLAEAVEGADAGNLAEARSEFGQFMTGWAQVKDAVAQRSGPLADRVEAAAARARRELGEDPPQLDEIQETLHTLQTAVDDANAQLGN